MEMLNIECSSWTNSRPESALAEIDSYSHPTFRNLLIEGHIRADSSMSGDRTLDESTCLDLTCQSSNDIVLTSEEFALPEP
jgi:hypothetical protein